MSNPILRRWHQEDGTVFSVLDFGHFGKLYASAEEAAHVFHQLGGKRLDAEELSALKEGLVYFDHSPALGTWVCVAADGCSNEEFAAKAKQIRSKFPTVVLVPWN